MCLAVHHDLLHKLPDPFAIDQVVKFAADFKGGADTRAIGNGKLLPDVFRTAAGVAKNRYAVRNGANIGNPGRIGFKAGIGAGYAKRIRLAGEDDRSE